MADPTGLLQYVLSAALGGAGGLGAFLLKLSSSSTKLQADLTHISNQVATLRTEMGTLATSLRDLTYDLRTLRTALDELEAQVEQVHRKLGDAPSRSELHSGTSFAAQEALNLRDKVNDLSAKLAGYATMEMLAKLSDDEARKWSELQRSLGQIEGLMKRISGMTPSPFPAVRRK